LNILHVTLNAGVAGFGVATVIRELSSSQSELGADVEIWSVDANTDRPDDLADDVAWHCFQVRGPIRLAWSPGMMKMARSVNCPAVVHQHSIWTAVSGVTRFLHQRRGVPSVIAPHGSLQNWALQKSHTRKAIAFSLYERDNLFNCSCLHALSSTELADFREFGLKNPVAIIPNGVSEQWLTSTGNGLKFRLRFGITAKKKILLYLSRVTPKKGLPMLCQAIADVRERLQGWVLVIAGPDEFGHTSELRELIEKLGLQHLVYLVGPVFGRDKRDVFAAAGAFVLPSYSEGLPMVVLEAMGVGLPVIVTEATPILAITQNSCGWRVPADQASLATVLLELSQKSSGELHAMGQNGKRVVASQYTWKQVARMTFALYRWLNNEGERPSFVVFD